MKSILVTGFEPFLGEKINPTEKLIAALPIENAGLEKLLLHVSFLKGFKQLQEHLHSKSYDFVLLLGQAGGRSKIEMERIAINRIDAEHADESGALFENAPISSDGPEAFISALPLRDWKDQATAQNLPIAISNSAGLFVCNYVYYRSFEILKCTDRSLFVHFPYLPEQVVDKPPGTPSLDLETMKKALDFILQKIRTQIMT